MRKCQKKRILVGLTNLKNADKMFLVDAGKEIWNVLKKEYSLSFTDGQSETWTFDVILLFFAL